MTTHLPPFVLSQIWLELSVVTKEKKRKEKKRLFARKKVEIERRRTGRLIPYQIPNAQKGRKKKERRTWKIVRMEENQRKKERRRTVRLIPSQIPNAGGHLGVP